MGAASRLFFDPRNGDVQTLYQRCTPSEEQFDEQRERWNSLAEYLEDELPSLTGYSIDTWLQGSYKFGTQIRPLKMDGEFDIDLGVYFVYPRDARSDVLHYQTLRNTVYQSIGRYARTHTEDIHGVVELKPRCVRIRYKNGFHIDVPIYVRYESDLSVMLASDDGWVDSNPKEIYRWFRGLFGDSKRFIARRQIRYLKIWSALNVAEQHRPSSILITVLVAEAIADLDERLLGDDDAALCRVVSKISERLGRSSEVLNPVNSGEPLNRLGQDKTEDLVIDLLQFQILAEAALAKNHEISAAVEWQRAFKHHFPLPDDDALILGRAALPTAGTSVATIFVPDVQVTAVPNSGPPARSVGMNEIGPLPRDWSLTFELVNASSLPPNSEVTWMVRNEGREAELINDLGHAGKTGTVVTERTAYKGRHFMECYVRRNGTLIGLRRIPVRVSGDSVPPRRTSLGRNWRKFLSGRK